MHQTSGARVAPAASATAIAPPRLLLPPRMVGSSSAPWFSAGKPPGLTKSA